MLKMNGHGVLKILRVFFGIFMIVVYLGMAYLLAVNYFDWSDASPWKQMRYLMVVVFGLYGFYRGYRQVKGLDYYRLNDITDEED